ncbi:hypothetical protein PF007_g1857 [Phytophthora fragariae]|nr:hypothetical protein PF007_g1857 [Phytophthora fragariae]
MGTSMIMIFSGHTEQNAGAALRVDDIDWHFIGLTLVACFFARFFNIFPLLRFSNCWRESSDRIPVKYMSVMWFVAQRGSIAFALAKNWNYIGRYGSHRQLVESTTLVVVLFTTIVVGGLTGPVLSKLRLTDHHSALRQSEPDANHEDASSSNDDRARALQRSTRHFMLRRNSRATETPAARPSSEEMNQEVEVDEDPVFTSRPQFRDDDYSGDEGERNEDSPQQRTETLTGAFFRNWQAFDAAYMQPIFGGSLTPANPRPVDDAREEDKTAV